MVFTRIDMSDIEMAKQGHTSLSLGWFHKGTAALMAPGFIVRLYGNATPMRGRLNDFERSDDLGHRDRIKNGI